MEDWIERARASWRWRGRQRPPFADEPGPGQESVWDYPRPPRVEPVEESARVEVGGVVLAESRRAVRVLETASAPAIYLPEADVRMEHLRRGAEGGVCEWKGPWVFWAVSIGERRIPRAAWSYTDPWQGYEELAGRLAFYPAAMDACWLGDERVTAQPGGFYGGWVTPAIVGPIKGGPGSGGW
jgi:uncharacterized protein (DUF427 family)